MTGVTMSAAGNSERELAVLGSAQLAGCTGEAVPRDVLVSPWGVVESANGTFLVDEEGGRLVIAAFEAQGTDLPIDYEHQTLGGGYASPTGQAPAAGWIKRLYVVPPVEPECQGDGAMERSFAGSQDRLRDEEEADTLAPSVSPERRRGSTLAPSLASAAKGGPGLYAVVEWTQPARAQLAARQYRYLSPVAIVRKSDRRLVALHSAALTNKPAIVGMCPLVNKQDLAQRREGAERIKTAECGPQIAGRAVGLIPAGKTAGMHPVAHGASWNAQSAVGEMGVSRLEDDGMTEALDRLRGQLGLEATVEGEAVLLAASKRIESLTEAASRSEAESRVVAAMEAGKLTEAQREWAVALAMKDAAAFAAWEASAPVVVSIGRIDGASVEACDAGSDRERMFLAAKARAEFRANPELERLTSEEAYVALAMREARRPHPF